MSYVGENGRYPEIEPPDPFVVAASALCGEPEAFLRFTRPSCHDVAERELRDQVFRIVRERIAREIEWSCARR